MFSDKLTDSEMSFLKTHHETLSTIFGKERDELKEKVFRMKRGEPRDIAIKFINKYDDWIQYLKAISKPPVEIIKEQF
jgi:hypothetical protein